MVFIRSERLFLRPGWPEDWTQLLALINDEGIVRNLAHAPWPYTADDARAFLGLAQEARLPRFLVTVPGAGIIGSVGLGSCEDGVELGYWIAREHWGRGYASEAGRAVLDVARMVGHRRLVASHFIDNPASGRVLEKIGFRRTGIVAERFSKGRAKAFLARGYALDLCSPDDRAEPDGSDLMRCRKAA